MTIYHYYTPAQLANRVSVAGQFADGILKISVARTSKTDNFSKKKGRKIAEWRLLIDNNIYASIPMEKCDGKLFLEAVKGIAETVRLKSIASKEKKKAKRIVVKNQFKGLARVR